jgi:hypothetical protein
MRVLPLAALSALAACASDHDLSAQGTEDPVLEMYAPKPGAFADTGPTTAKGKAQGLSEVTVNGKAAKMDGPNFSTSVELVRGINVVEVTAEDSHGDEWFQRHGVLAGAFAKPSGPVEDALRVRVNQPGLDSMADLAAGMITLNTINDAATGMNPVYTDSYGVWGWDAVTIGADIAYVAFSQPRIAIEPSAGELSLVVEIPHLEIGIYAYGDVIGIDFDTNVYLYSSDAVISGTLEADVRRGKIDVDLTESSVDLKDFSYDTTALPGDVESYILVDTIRAYIEDMLVTKIDEMVPPLLDETLSGLDPSFSTEMLGLQVDMAFTFAELDIDKDGLALDMDLDISVPASGAHSGEGYLSSGGGEPDIDTHADVSGAMSDDLVNRVLYEAWAGGLLDLSMSTEDDSLSPPMLATLKATEGSVKVDADLPPVLVERDGELAVQVGELLVTIDTPDGEMGSHLVVAIAATIGIELGIEDGSIVLSMEDPELVLAVRESDWGASNERVTRLMEEMLPLDTLLSLLGSFSFPVPSLYGITIDSGEAYRDQDGVHTGIEVNLR